MFHALRAFKYNFSNYLQVLGIANSFICFASLGPYLQVQKNCKVQLEWSSVFPRVFETEIRNNFVKLTSYCSFFHWLQ